MDPVKIIFDTDIGGDCDDSAALALLHELANAGECELLATTHCYEGNHYAACIDGINRYYGRPEVPVGAFHKGIVGQPDTYASAAARQFPNRYMGEMAPDTLRVMRRVLVKAEDDSVVLVAVGPLCSLAALVESKADDISPLTGQELIARKIRRTVIMGGRFAHQWPDPIMMGDTEMRAEWNIRVDIKAAQTVCEKWPGELVFSSFEIGSALITGARMQKESYPWNPVGFCFQTWHDQISSNKAGRESWDPATALYAVQPDNGLWDLHEYGRITVDDRGVTTWTADAECRHTLVIEKAPLDEVCRAIDELMERDLERKKV